MRIKNKNISLNGIKIYSINKSLLTFKLLEFLRKTLINEKRF